MICVQLIFNNPSAKVPIHLDLGYEIYQAIKQCDQIGWLFKVLGDKKTKYLLTFRLFW